MTPATAMGIGGFEFEDSSGLEAQYLLGSPFAQSESPGIHQVTWTLNVERMQTTALLLKSLRNVGTGMPWLTLGLGKQYDDGSKTAKQIQDCKINTTEFTATAGGYVSFTHSGLGGLVTNLTTLSPANLTTPPYRWYELVLTRNGVAFGCCRSLRVSMNHNLDAQVCIPGAAPATDPRGNTFLTEGNETTTVEFERSDSPGDNMQASTYTPFDIVLVGTTTATPVQTFTLTLANCTPVSERQAVAPATDYSHRIIYAARSWNLTSTP